MDKSLNLFLGFFLGCGTTVSIIYIIGQNYQISYDKKKGLEFNKYSKIENFNMEIIENVLNEIVEDAIKKEIILEGKIIKREKEESMNDEESINDKESINNEDNINKEKDNFIKEKVNNDQINNQNSDEEDRKLIFTDEDSEILDESEVLNEIKNHKKRYLLPEKFNLLKVLGFV